MPPKGRHNYQLYRGYALTVFTKKSIEEILAGFAQESYLQYVVYAEEVGPASGKKHFHIYVRYACRRQIGNHHFNEILGAHPYLQEVPRGRIHRQRLWNYYLKDGTAGVWTKIPEHRPILAAKVRQYVEEYRGTQDYIERWVNKVHKI